MDTNLNSSNNFSLLEDDRIDEALKKLGKNQGRLAAVAVCITWLPLVIITAIEGTLYSGTQMPFLNDIAMHARLLAAIPMLIMIKPAIESKVIVVIKYLSEALMNAEEQQLIFSKALHRAKKLTSSTITEFTLLLIVFALTISLVLGDVLSGLRSGTESWMVFTNAGEQSLSVSGYWSIIISIPIFQFFFLRWLWRYFVWSLLIFRLSRSRLKLLNTHADRAGGIGIIMLAQRSFNLIFVAGSFVISGQFIAQLIALPDTFNTVRIVVIAYIIFCLLLLIMPMLFFADKLFKLKNEALLNHSYFSVMLSHKFENEWINDLPVEKRIEEAQVDPSMVYDYSGIYDSVQKIRPVPVTIQDIIGMGVSLVIPFTPILLIHYSVAELLQKIAGLLM